jgi:ketose-bisphosphate aldolase
MPITKMSQLLEHARQHQYAVGYFEAWDTYSLEAVLEAAEELRSPVMLGFGGMTMNQEWLDRFGIEPLGRLGHEIAQAANVPVSFILNEVLRFEHVIRGVCCGFNVVMMHSCELSFDENVRLTKQIVEAAHSVGVEVQAELGKLPTFGEDETRVLTDPDEAARFVEQTGIDTLAVSIGNVHLKTRGGYEVDLDRLKEIRRMVQLPLAFHGTTGLPRGKIPDLITHGISLFHVGTILKKVALETLQSEILDYSCEPNYQQVMGSRKEQDILGRSQKRIKATVEEYLTAFKCAGKADTFTHIQ